MTSWVEVCRYADLDVERGCAALLDGRQVAIFRLHDGSVHAVGNLDPFSGAQVMARGLVGTRGDTDVVASPMHKQGFDLRTGQCLDDSSVSIPVYAVRVRDGLVEIAAGAAS